jgi:tetratricopeptide (TPR) repeat protein
MLAAQIGMQRNDWSEAERWLRQAAESEVTPAEQKLIVDEYYFVLLWKLEYRRAFSFAERTAKRIAASGGDPSIWLERTGDALFLDGAPAQAKRFYEQALEKNPRAWGPNTKLSDVHFRLGNLERERHYRQKVYGTLAD